MECFCISLRLSDDSQNLLKKHFTSFDITALARNTFYHTTLLQGLTSSYENIPNSEELKSYINSYDSNIKNLLINWDMNLKRVDSVIFHKFNESYMACVLNYKYSDLIIEISNDLDKIFSETGIYYYPVSKLHNSYLIKDNYRKAYDFQYKSRIGNLEPHTTLGFINSGNKKDISIPLLEDNNILDLNSLRHDSVVLSKLDDYCMTPYHPTTVLLELI